MRRKSNSEMVLKALDRAYPEYLWAYAISRLVTLYEGKNIYAASLFEAIAALIDEGLIERKKPITAEEARQTIDALVRMEIIPKGEFTSSERAHPAGYRITYDGKRARADYETPRQERLSPSFAPSPA